MEWVAWLKRTCNLAPVIHIVQKIPENYCPIVTSGVVVQKIYPKMHHVLCINTHHDVTDLASHGMLRNTKTWIFWEQNITFLWNEKILKLYLKWHILRSYYFVVEVTFKICTKTSFSNSFLSNALPNLDSMFLQLWWRAVFINIGFKWN